MTNMKSWPSRSTHTQPAYHHLIWVMLGVWPALLHGCSCHLPASLINCGHWLRAAGATITMSTREHIDFTSSNKLCQRCTWYMWPYNKWLDMEKETTKKCNQDYFSCLVHGVSCKSIVLIFIYLVVSLKGLSWYSLPKNWMLWSKKEKILIVSTTIIHDIKKQATKIEIKWTICNVESILIY